MRTTTVYIATSLDGYIATADGGLDWLNAVPNPDGSDYGYAKFIKNIDAILMGRNTFEVVRGFGEWSYTTPVIVLSHSLKHLPDELEGKVTIASGSPAELLAQCEARGLHHLYIDGGQTIQAFLQADLVDNLIITRLPILLGGGIPLFGEIPQQLALTHIATESFSNGLVQSTYRRTKG
jgi:dihydrofolate reductase